MIMKEKGLYIKLIPVMLAFFAMGFVDLVGIASNYVKADLNLTDSEANIFPSLVFFWFLILCSNRNADEPDRTEEDCITQPVRYIFLFAAPNLWRWLYADAYFLFSAGYR